MTKSFCSLVVPTWSAICRFKAYHGKSLLRERLSCLLWSICQILDLQVNFNAFTEENHKNGELVIHIELAYLVLIQMKITENIQLLWQTMFSIMKNRFPSNLSCEIYRQFLVTLKSHHSALFWHFIKGCKTKECLFLHSTRWL